MTLLHRRGRGTRRPSERIHLVSWAGFPNYGDELITARWLRFLARHRPHAEVHLDTRFPGMTGALFAGMHPRLVATDAVFRALDAVLRYEQRTIGELVRDLGTPHFDLLLEDLREADTVHVLGGGWQNSRWADNALALDALRAVSEHSGARLLATGQGLMPAGPASFDGFDHVSVRDVPSAELLGIERGYDDAYLLGPSAVPRRRSSSEVEEVVLCIQDDLQDEGSFERNVAYAREAVRALGIPRERVRYVEAIPGTDHPGYAALSDVVAEDGFVPFGGMWREGLEMGPHQLWISTRFHHHLVASLHGARGVALVGDTGYYDIKHRSIAELGSHWTVTAAEDSTIGGLHRMRPPGRFRRPLAAKLAEARALYPRQR